MQKSILLVIVLIMGIGGRSQNKTFRFSHLSTAEGLSQSSAIAIHQDNLGQIWIGTRDGLNKYDGSKITIYRNEYNNPNSISNNDVLSIHQDLDGYIWIGTYNGLNKYDPKKDTFTSYFHSNDNNSLSNNHVPVIAELANGEMWFGTTNGLSIYNKQEDSFTNYFKSESLGGLAENEIKSIYQTKSGDIFVGTTSGLSQMVKLANNRYTFNTIPKTITFDVQDIIESDGDNILIGTRRASVLQYNVTTKKITPYFSEETLAGKNKSIRRLLFDNDGHLWIGTYNGLQIANKNRIIAVLVNELNDPNSLSKSSIKSLFRDKKGSIWIGTYYGGVNIWDESNVNFVNFSQNSGKTSLGYNVVSSIQKHNDLVYFGTEGDGISVLDTRTATMNYINRGAFPELPDNNIKSLLIYRSKYLLIGTFNKGISVYNIKTNRLESSFFPNSIKNYLNNVGVYSIKTDNNGDIWVGTFGKGVLKYISKKKEFEIFLTSTRPNGLSNDLVRTLEIDSGNKVWVGTQTGLSAIEPEGNIINYFGENEHDISTVFEDSKGTIWAGTKVKGIFKFNGQSFDNLGLKIENRSISAIHSIVEDREGTFWISTNHGIIKYNQAEKTSMLFTQKEGLISNEFNDNASLLVDGNKFYFGSPAGATYFDSNNLITNEYTPQVIITDFKIGNESILIGDKNKLLSQTIEYTKTMELSHIQGNFNISFATPSFINSKGNHYKYRLRGLEEDWIETSGNLASYTIQNPGNYVFEVKGANSDGLWNGKATQLQIKVNPAPWRSWWAFTLYLLMIGLAIYGLLRIMRSKSKLKHELELEHLEMERAKEVNKAKLQFFTNISHEFRTPLALITGPLQQIIAGYSGTNTIYKKLLVIESNANHLLKLINRLMDFRKFENNQFRLEAAEGNIIKFLHEIFLSFSEYAKDGGYHYEFKVSHEEIQVYYDRYKLERVFYNLISNAFRYTPKGGEIVVLAKKENNKIAIEVQDSGVGIAEEHLDKIFDRFFEVNVHNNPENNYTKGTGIGLSIANNIVKLHKGDIQVENKKDKGAIFRVELPLGKSHLSDEEILGDFKVSDDVAQYTIQLSSEAIELSDELQDLAQGEKKYTILVVEDNGPLRAFIKDLLKTDYNVLEAENGKVALKKVVKHLPDLVISDVIMPKMVGTELCSAIKKTLKTSHIPVILLTSRTSLIYKFEGLESGADDYISKPFNLREFKLRVKNLLDSKQRLQERFSKEDTFAPSDIAVSSIDEELLKKAFEIVQQNIDNEDFDIPFFCSELGVSRSLLFTKIKAWTNFTPNEFIHEIRLKRAAQLLEQHKISVSQVCYKVGFRTPRYFSKCFQKKYGLTPSQFADKFSDHSIT